MGVDVKTLIREVITVESQAIQGLLEQIDDRYSAAVDLLEKCEGKAVVVGVGKSGIIGKKIAASLASTGTPAFFVHATEAVHGDSGMIEETDVAILISNSGETAEVLSVIPIIQQIGAKMISITSNHCSTVARAAHVSLAYDYEREADHLNLAPTTSAVLALVIGDALAVSLSILKGFTDADFHLYHPGGSLGAQLAEAKVQK
ncbi:MAG: SIS domain-containing protein [Firmicutes bacterium]|nr:SIS domain-containing protein [Bacillota bacterium]